MTPAQMDEWLAYRQIEPEPTERIIEVLKRGFNVLASSWGAKLDPDKLDPAHDELITTKATASSTPSKGQTSSPAHPGGHQEVSPNQAAMLFSMAVNRYAASK